MHDERWCWWLLPQQQQQQHSTRDNEAISPGANLRRLPGKYRDHRPWGCKGCQVLETIPMILRPRWSIMVRTKGRLVARQGDNGVTSLIATFMEAFGFVPPHLKQTQEQLLMELEGRSKWRFSNYLVLLPKGEMRGPGDEGRPPKMPGMLDGWFHVLFHLLNI